MTPMARSERVERPGEVRAVGQSGLRPKVVVVGGPDVDARLEFIQRMRATVDVSVLGSRPALQPRFLAEGIAYRSYRLSRGVNPFADLLTVGELTLILRRVRPHIVHAFDTKPGVWGCLAARMAGVPVVIGTITGLGSLYASDSLPVRLLRTVYEVLQTLACRVSDAVVFQNDEDARQFISQGMVPPHRAIVLPGSGVATELFDPARIPDDERARVRAELGLQREHTVVTMVSRVMRSKGVLEFAAAAGAVTGHDPSVRFVLIGSLDGAPGDRLDATQLDLLRCSVLWPGPRRDIAAVLAVSDVFVLPSAYREGIPRVLLEAASMGVPIVTTDSPGCNQVVEDGLNGFLVPVRHTGALGRAISRLVGDPDLRRRFGRIARQRAVSRFDLTIVAQQTHRMYCRLLAQKRLRPFSDTIVLGEA